MKFVLSAVNVSRLPRAVLPARHAGSTATDPAMDPRSLAFPGHDPQGQPPRDGLHLSPLGPSLALAPSTGLGFLSLVAPSAAHATFPPPQVQFAITLYPTSSPSSWPPRNRSQSLACFDSAPDVLSLLSACASLSFDPSSLFHSLHHLHCICFSLWFPTTPGLSLSFLLSARFVSRLAPLPLLDTLLRSLSNASTFALLHEIIYPPCCLQSLS